MKTKQEPWIERAFWTVLLTMLEVGYKIVVTIFALAMLAWIIAAIWVRTI